MLSVRPSDVKPSKYTILAEAEMDAAFDAAAPPRDMELLAGGAGPNGWDDAEAPDVKAWLENAEAEAEAGEKFAALSAKRNEDEAWTEMQAKFPKATIAEFDLVWAGYLKTGVMIYPPRAPRPAPDSDDAIRAEFLGDDSADAALPAEPGDFFADLGTDLPAPEPVPHLVPGLIQHGLAVPLSGPGGANKSRLMMQLAMALAHGRQMFVPRASATEPAVPISHVEMLCYEYDDGEARRRKLEIARAIGNLPEAGTRKATVRLWPLQGKSRPILIVSDVEPMFTLTEFGCAELRHLKAVKAAGKKSLWVLDNLTDAVEFQGHALVNDQVVRRMVQMLNRWCRKLDMTILALLHPSRSGVGRGDLGFSHELEDAFRQVLTLAEVTRRPKSGEPLNEMVGTNVYRFAVKKWNNGPKSSTHLIIENGLLVPIAETGGAKDVIAAAAETVLRLTYGSSQRAAEIAMLSGIDRDMAERAYPDRLCQNGRAWKFGGFKFDASFMADNIHMQEFRARIGNATATAKDFIAAAASARAMGYLDYRNEAAGGHDLRRAGYCAPADDGALPPTTEGDGMGDGDELGQEWDQGEASDMKVN